MEQDVREELKRLEAKIDRLYENHGQDIDDLKSDLNYKADQHHSHN